MDGVINSATGSGAALPLPPADAYTVDGITFFTAASLTEDDATPEWIVAPLFAAGCITELTGEPKAAGKTSLILHACRAVIRGEDFLGHPTQQGRVLYLTEQSKGSFSPQVADAGLLGCADLRYLTYPAVGHRNWLDIADAARTIARRMSARLLVVDTLPAFAGLQGDAENHAGSALAAIKPLQQIANDGVSVVVVRHDRKAGGNVGSAGRGSNAFTGAADILLQLVPVAGQRPTIRQLNGRGRYPGIPEQWSIEKVSAHLEDEGRAESIYMRLGDNPNIATMEAGLLIDRELQIPLSISELLDRAPQGSRSTIQRELDRRIELGLVVKQGKGTKGNPYTFVNAADSFCPPDFN